MHLKDKRKIPWTSGKWFQADWWPAACTSEKHTEFKWKIYVYNEKQRIISRDTYVAYWNRKTETCHFELNSHCHWSILTTLSRRDGPAVQETRADLETRPYSVPSDREWLLRMRGDLKSGNVLGFLQNPLVILKSTFILGDYTRSSLSIERVVAHSDGHQLSQAPRWIMVFAPVPPRSIKSSIKAEPLLTDCSLFR